MHHPVIFDSIDREAGVADANQVNEGQDAEREDASAAEDKTPVSPAKKRRIRIILLVVAAVVVIGGVFWYANYKSVGQYMQATNDAFIQADAVTVAPKVSGYVDKVFVGENQNVQAGQPLLQIDTRDYRAQTAQIEAQIGVARANAEGVQAQIKEQQAAIDRAQAELRAAQSDAAFAQALYPARRFGRGEPRASVAASEPGAPGQCPRRQRLCGTRRIASSHRHA
jgi:membrane fusion protein, multidrug efflux system